MEMDGIVILSKSQLAEFDKSCKKERKSKKKHRLERKKNKKDYKRETKQNRRNRRGSSSSSSEFELRIQRRSRSTSSSSTSSSSDGEDQVHSILKKEQEKSEEAVKRVKLADESNQRREAAGLGWMTQSSSAATLPQTLNPSKSNSSAKFVAQDQGKKDDDLLEFDTLAKPKQTVQNEEQEKRDPLSMKNPMFPKHLVVALGDHTMLMMPPASTSLLSIDDDVKPVWIVPLTHALSIRDADGPVLEEVDKFKLSLVNMFRSQNKMTVFMEQSSVRFNQRTKLECIGMDTEYAESLPIIFGKEIAESDQEWTENEKLLDLKTKSLRQGLPPRTPYFFVEIYDVFPNQGPVIRYAHIIESDAHFARNFGWNIIRGVLGKETMKSKSRLNAPSASGSAAAAAISSSTIERNRLLEMLEMYKEFDWTSELEGGEHQV